MSTTFTEILARRLRSDPAQPLVTFYDHTSDERVELSVATYANWVAKAASLLVDELDLERGDRIRIDLPPHWLSTVFLGAAWTAGLVVTDEDDPDAVVCGPAGLATWAPQAAERVVLACALLPLGVRFPEQVPAGVHDVGVEIWSQPDAFTPWDPPEPDDAALARAGIRLTQADLGTGPAAAEPVVPVGGRLLTTANPATEPAVFTDPLRQEGSVVLVAQADRDRLEATYAAERATVRFPA
ncbi:TIGR03089 family protein [Nocardioides panacisoli]|uniref:TIGR03089 family protein n=1 Tax=Nocardioides panacisoli TaxID=627624 RepID=UPI001C626CA3|nr:TIGR03089 family protein [Nocardioides panacisoli]QYJ04399.1 TIGR03089 family protein [Nocardioides panacisoli]